MSRMRHINMQQSSKYTHISEGRQLSSIPFGDQKEYSAYLLVEKR